MNAEYNGLESSDILVYAEVDDKLDRCSNSFWLPYVVGLVFESLGNSIDFTIDEVMDDCGYFYSFGEPMYMGNDYAVYPFCIDDVVGLTEYYLTPENLVELIKTGRTVIEAL